MTRDSGKTWTNVTKNIPNLPPWGTVRQRRASRYDAGTAYVTVDFHQVNNRDPFVYKTTDYGETWKSITNGIPQEHVELRALRSARIRCGAACCISAPRTASTCRSTTATTWQPLQNNLPHAPVYWHRRAGALQRPGDLDLRARLLDPRRHHAAARMTPQSARGRRAPVPAAAGVPLPRHHASVNALRRSDGRREPAVRRLDQLLPEVSRATERRDHDSGRKRADGSIAERAGPGRSSPRVLGSARHAVEAGGLPDQPCVCP